MARWVVISFLLLVLFSCKNKEGVFSVEGRIPGFNKELYIIQLNADFQFMTDTIQLESDGSFSYVSDTDSLKIILLMENKDSWIPLFVNSGYNVHVDAKNSCLNLAEVKGGIMNEKLGEFKKRTKSILERKCNIEHAITEIFKDEENEDKDVIVLEQLRPDLVNLNHSLGIQVEQYVKNNPSEIESVLLLLDIFCRNNNYEKLQRSLSILKGPAKSFYLTDILLNLAGKMQQVDIGQKAPDFTMSDTLGNKVSLSDYSGKYLLLHFWASDEPFSRASNKYYLKTVYEESCRQEETSRFSILGVCLDKDEKLWKQTLMKDKMLWDNVSDLKGFHSDIMSSYGMFFQSSRNFLINPDGVIIAQDVKSRDIITILHQDNF